VITSILTILANVEGEAEQGIAALGIDPWAILAQGATFLVLFFLIKKFALSKIVTTLEDRRKTIEGSLDKAEELNKKNEDAEERVGKLLGKARKDAEVVLEKSKEEAASMVKEAENVAGTKAEKILADGEQRIKAEVEKAKIELKKETLDLVAQTASVVLGETVDGKKNEELIKKALKETE
jgi:F-type H+-transporting ATPase subunit b